MSRPANDIELLRALLDAIGVRYDDPRPSVESVEAWAKDQIERTHEDEESEWIGVDLSPLMPRFAEFSWRDQKWCCNDRNIWKKGPKLDLPVLLSFDPEDAAKRAVRFISSATPEITEGVTYEVVGGDVRLSTGKILPDYLLPILQEGEVHAATIGKTPCYVVFRKAEIVAILAEGAQRWRE